MKTRKPGTMSRDNAKQICKRIESAFRDTNGELVCKGKLAYVCDISRTKGKKDGQEMWVYRIAAPKKFGWRADDLQDLLNRTDQFTVLKETDGIFLDTNDPKFIWNIGDGDDFEAVTFRHTGHLEIWVRRFNADRYNLGE